MLGILAEELDRFDGLVTVDSLHVASYAEACVLLFVHRLCEEGGFTNEQTVYPYGIGFEPAMFLDIRPTGNLGIDREYDFELIRLGCAAMLLADIKDAFDEGCAQPDDWATIGRSEVAAALERALPLHNGAEGRAMRDVLEEARRPSSLQDFERTSLALSVVYRSLRRRLTAAIHKDHDRPVEE